MVGYNIQKLFLYIIFFYLDSTTNGVDLSFIRVLRLLRTLRPLRFISHNVSMKLVVTALLESVSGILNVTIFMLLIWIMFAILGINLMKDKLNYCDLPSNSLLPPSAIYSISEEEVNIILSYFLVWKNKKCFLEYI